MKLKNHKKLAIRTTAIAGTLLVCGSALTSSPLVMHADEAPETATTHTETVSTTPTNATTTIDNTKWTAVDKAKTITRTIHYIDENGKTVAPDNVESHTAQIFTTKQGDTDVKRAFTIKNGVATNTIPKFAAVTSPSVKGYTLKNTTYSKIPEQGWSLDGTQPKDANGFYTNLNQDEVINVVYSKDANSSDELKDSVPVAGYTVLSVKKMTRTINYVDAKGKKLADSVVETVKYETVASDKLTPAEQAETKNQKIAVVKVNKDAKGNVISQDTQILTVPSYKLNDVKSPKVKGYKLQNSKFKTLSGQYMWLSTDPYVHATLDNGLPQYMTQDEIVDVVYVPSTNKSNKKTKDTKKKTTKGTKDAKSGKTEAGSTAATAAAGNDSDGGSGSGSAGSGASSAASTDGDVGSGSGSVSDGDAVGSSDASGDTSSSGGVELPQTGNKKSSSALLGSGIAMLLSSFAFAWDGLKKKFTH